MVVAMVDTAMRRSEVYLLNRKIGIDSKREFILLLRYLVNQVLDSARIRYMNMIIV